MRIFYKKNNQMHILRDQDYNLEQNKWQLRMIPRQDRNDHFSHLWSRKGV